MSMFFVVDGVPTWNTSNPVARTVIGQARSLENLAGDSGFADLDEDESHISGEQFSVFVDRLLAIHADDRLPVQNMVAGFLGVALVLAERANLTIPSFDDSLSAAWAQTLSDLSKAMPYPDARRSTPA